MAESGLSIEPDRRVGLLTVGEKQRVEVLKVLYRAAPASGATSPPPS
jgi:ABC-type uncharacterized transport system ATPase subunit